MRPFGKDSSNDLSLMRKPSTRLTNLELDVVISVLETSLDAWDEGERKEAAIRALAKLKRR